MEFILEQQAQFAVSIQRLQEERVRDQSIDPIGGIIPVAGAICPSDG